jgi:hypothetical protein
MSVRGYFLVTFGRVSLVEQGFEAINLGYLSTPIYRERLQVK